MNRIYLKYLCLTVWVGVFGVALLDREARGSWMQLIAQSEVSAVNKQMLGVNFEYSVIGRLIHEEDDPLFKRDYDSGIKVAVGDYAAFHVDDQADFRSDFAFDKSWSLSELSDGTLLYTKTSGDEFYIAQDQLVHHINVRGVNSEIRKDFLNSYKINGVSIFSK